MINVKDIFDEIDIKYLIIGSAIFTFFPVMAFEYLDILIFLAFFGLILVGYKSNSRIQGAVLGAIATLPLFIVALTGRLGDLGGSITGIPLTVLILISLLIMGSLGGFAGAYFYTNQKKGNIQKKERDANKDNKKNNEKLKSKNDKNKFKKE
ncbi:MAG: hypothetical protein ACRCVG_01725 [Methanobacteriaceae archaeon]